MSEDSSASSSTEEEVAGARQTKRKRMRISLASHPHIKMISDGSIPMFHCAQCGKKFKTRAHIKYHAYCLSKDDDKPFKCSECGKGFVSRSHYEYHLRVHAGELPFPCEQCGKRFNQRGKLNRHQMSVHSGEKPFACDQCHKAFANKQALTTHTRTHTGERPFACTYCDKRFSGITNLKKHTVIHTGERPFKCLQCGKKFGLKWTLDLHLRTHSNERPFGCDHCSKAFTNRKDLRRHYLIHFNVRPWICFLCGYKPKFRRKDNLVRHIRQHSEDRQEEAIKLAEEAAAKSLNETFKTSEEDKASTSRNAAVTQVASTSSDAIKNGTRHNKIRHNGQQAKSIKRAKKAAANYRKVKVKTSVEKAPKKGVPVVNSMTLSNTESVIRFAPESNSTPGGTNITNATPAVEIAASDLTDASSGDAEKDTQSSFVLRIPENEEKLVYQCQKCLIQISFMEHFMEHALYCQASRDDQGDASGNTIRLQTNDCPPESSHDSQDSSSFAMTVDPNCTADTDTANLPFICPECYMSFTTTDELNAHTELHLNESFACTLCSKRFFYYSCLESHLATHPPVSSSSSSPNLEAEEQVFVDLQPVTPLTSEDTGISAYFLQNTPLGIETTIIEGSSQGFLSSAPGHNSENELEWCHALINAVHATADAI